MPGGRIAFHGKGGRAKGEFKAQLVDEVDSPGRDAPSAGFLQEVFSPFKDQDPGPGLFQQKGRDQPGRAGACYDAFIMNS